MSSKHSKTTRANGWLITLAILGCLSGCDWMNRMPLPPPKPTLTITPTPDGGMCLDERNTYKLADYILRLERGYE